MSGEIHDWTRGPAKWLGAGALGGAAIVALIWSLVARTSPADAAPAEDPSATHAPAHSDPPPLREAPSVATGDLSPPPAQAGLSQPPQAPPATDASRAPEPAQPNVDPPAPRPQAEGPIQPPGQTPPAGAAPASTPPASPATGTPPPAPSPPKTETKPASIARKINLNTASQAELESLPDIGPALAQRIIEFRASKGPFRRVDELDAVRGIGPRTLERLRPLVTTE